MHETTPQKGGPEWRLTLSPVEKRCDNYKSDRPCPQHIEEKRNKLPVVQVLKECYHYLSACCEFRSLEMDVVATDEGRLAGRSRCVCVRGNGAIGRIVE